MAVFVTSLYSHSSFTLLSIEQCLNTCSSKYEVYEAVLYKNKKKRTSAHKAFYASFSSPEDNCPVLTPCLFKV